MAARHGARDVARVRHAIAKRIRSAQKKSGKTDVAVIAEVLVDRGTWHHWKNGQRPIPSDVLPRIAKCLGVSVAWIMGLEPARPRDTEGGELFYKRGHEMARAA